jgi:hypothetical protein
MPLANYSHLGVNVTPPRSGWLCLRFLWEEVVRRQNGLGMLSKPSLLKSESSEAFEAIHVFLVDEIKPQGIIEQMYVEDISSILWEILRLRRCKSVIINSAFRAALEQLLTELMRTPSQPTYTLTDKVQNLALGWFQDQGANKAVAEVLDQFGLDESAIEAEAIRRSAPDIELLDRMLASLEARRTRALHCISQYRDSLARRLEESAARIIEAKKVPRLEHAAGKRASAA